MPKVLLLNRELRAGSPPRRVQGFRGEDLGTTVFMQKYSCHGKILSLEEYTKHANSLMLANKHPMRNHEIHFLEEPLPPVIQSILEGYRATEAPKCPLAMLGFLIAEQERAAIIPKEETVPVAYRPSASAASGGTAGASNQSAATIHAPEAPFKELATEIANMPPYTGPRVVMTQPQPTKPVEEAPGPKIDLVTASMGRAVLVKIAKLEQIDISMCDKSALVVETINNERRRRAMAEAKAE